MSAQSDIFDRLKLAPAFHPGAVELFDDITLEPGDIVKILSGSDEKLLPIYNQVISWTGSAMVSLESTGNEQRSAIPPLQKKQAQTSFSSGRSAYGQSKLEKDVSQFHTEFTKTDTEMCLVAEAIGVKLDADGKPVVDKDGKLVYDETSAAKIFSNLKLTYNQAALISAINDKNGNKISGARVDVSAEGQAIVEAINDKRTGTAQIVGNRIKINTDTGSCISIDENGNIDLTAKTVTDAINKSNGTAKVTISGDHVLLKSNSGSTINLSERVEIDSSGYTLINGVVLVKSTGENAKQISINNGKITATDLQVSSGGSLVFSADSGTLLPARSLTWNKVSNLITGVKITGPVDNVYTLEYQQVSTGDTWNKATVTFSRATTLYKSDYKIGDVSKKAGWSSGTFTVRAEPQEAETSTRLAGIAQSGDITRSSIPKYVTFPFKINYIDDDENEKDTGFRGVNKAIATVSVDASLIYEDGKEEGITEAKPTSIDTTAISTAYGTVKVNPTLFAKNADGDNLTSQQVVLEKTTYNIDADTTNHCVNLKIGTKIIGRISTESVYEEGYSAGGGGVVNVNVDKGSWTNGKIDFTPSEGTGSGASVSLKVTPSVDWSSANVPANPTFRIYDGSISTQLSGTFYLQVTDDYVYVKSDSATSSPTYGTNVMARRTNTAYSHGQQSVNVSSATLSNITANASARTASASLTITLDNGKTPKTIDNVDVSSIYQAGLDGGSAITTKNFSIKLADNNGSGTVVKTVTQSVDVSDVYQKGKDDAKPSTDYPYPATVVASSGSTVRMRSSPSTSAGTVTSVPVGATIYCYYDPSGYTDEWMPVKYGAYTGYMMSKFISGATPVEKEIYGVYSSGFSGSNVRVGIKVSGSTSLTAYILCSNKSAAYNCRGGVYDVASGTPSAVYSSSSLAIGKKCRIVYSDNSESGEFTILDENA